jgi:hypothetical protein
MERARDPVDAAEDIPATKNALLPIARSGCYDRGFLPPFVPLAERWRMYGPATANHIGDARSGPR